MSTTKATTQPQTLVSVIVTTYNNHATLDACLQSICDQTYPNLEIIVVDNSSTDDTKEIAQRFTNQVYNKGPERCAQRNYGLSLAKGEYVVFIDSDMELDPGVVEACVEAVGQDPGAEGIIIPEDSFGVGFWAQCKRLERSFYVGVDWIEAARFYHRQTLLEIGGYNEALVSGEDWDLSQRFGAVAKIRRITTYIHHNEGHFKLFTTLRKKAYYAQKFTAYTAADATPTTPKNTTSPAGAGRNPYIIVLRRFGLYFSHPVKLFRNPFLGVGVLFMKVCEFGFGAFGYLFAGKEPAKNDRVQEGGSA